MKYTMNSLIAVLLSMAGLATAHSLASNQNVMGKKLMVTRREAESQGQMDVMTTNFTLLQDELANLSIPSYLSNLYINLTYLGEEHLLNHKKINTVRTYQNQAESARCGHVKFNINNDTIGEEEIIRVELHLLQNNLTELPSHYKVDIHFLLSENDTWSPVQISIGHIDSTPGWKKLDIATFVSLWRSGWANHGLQITLSNGLKCEEVYADEEDPQERAHNQPMLVVFTHDQNSKFLKKVLKEVKPMVNHTSAQQQKRNTINVENIACHLKDMNVTADSINSTDIIMLFPKIIDVGICEGHCKRLQPTPPTDHAYILSLYYHNNVNLSEVPSKCCVPTSYGKKHIIFYNKASCEHILKKDLAVEAKGCSCL